MRSSAAALAMVVNAIALAWASIAASYETDWPVGFFVGVVGGVC